MGNCCNQPDLLESHYTISIENSDGSINLGYPIAINTESSDDSLNNDLLIIAAQSSKIITESETGHKYENTSKSLINSSADLKPESIPNLDPFSHLAQPLQEH